MNLTTLQNDPVKFRKHLRIDVDGTSKQLSSVVDPWQNKDFESLDDGWKRVAGKSTTGKIRGWLERPRGHSKTSDIGVLPASVQNF